MSKKKELEDAIALFNSIYHTKIDPSTCVEQLSSHYNRGGERTLRRYIKRKFSEQGIKVDPQDAVEAFKLIYQGKINRADLEVCIAMTYELNKRNIKIDPLKFLLDFPDYKTGVFHTGYIFQVTNKKYHDLIKSYLMKYLGVNL